MSRFFASTADNESDSSEEEASELPAQRPAFNYSSEEEDVKRVVKPAKEKYYAELKGIIQLIINYKKICDYVSLLDGFDDLVKAFSKVQNVLKNDESAPPFLICCLGDLQQFVSSVWDNTEGRKALTKMGYKALATLRQKLRKFNKQFENDLEAYFADPERYSSYNAEEATENEKEGESGNSSQWDNSGSESESDGNVQYGNFRECFLKKVATADTESNKRERKEKKRIQEAKREEEDDQGGWETVKGGVSAPPLQRDTLFASNVEVTVAAVNAKLKETLITRSSKREERRQRIEVVHALLGIVLERGLAVGMAVKLRLAEIYALFDYNVSALESMKPEYWRKLLTCMVELAQELHTGDVRIQEDIEDENESLESAPYQIRGSLAALLDRLALEFAKGLKRCDPLTTEYTLMLRDEKEIVAIIDKVINYLEAQNDVAALCCIKLCRIEHMYYKFDEEVFNIDRTTVSSLDVMDKLCKYLYVHDTSQRLRTRAILAQIYHLALHDQWTRARDLMLMSHLQGTIQHADPRTQILFNRTMAQLGLCAFRHGLYAETHMCLGDLVTTGRMREMLGQGFTPIRNAERSHEQELRDRQYQVPFHMTINLELLECWYLVSAMLLDVPWMAAQELDARRRLISKAFYQTLRSSERLSLIGPPETMREHVVAASRALRAAKWRECQQFIFNPKMQAKVWNMVLQPTPLKQALMQAIQKQGLKSYIFAYAAAVYDSLHLPKLAAMFEMSEKDVHCTLAAMIANGELNGSMDVPSQTLVVTNNSSYSTIQALVYQLADKLVFLLDSTERCWERPGRPNVLQSRPLRILNV